MTTQIEVRCPQCMGAGKIMMLEAIPSSIPPGFACVLKECCTCEGRGKIMVNYDPWLGGLDTTVTWNWTTTTDFNFQPHFT